MHTHNLSHPFIVMKLGEGGHAVACYAMWITFRQSDCWLCYNTLCCIQVVLPHHPMRPASPGMQDVLPPWTAAAALEYVVAVMCHLSAALLQSHAQDSSGPM